MKKIALIAAALILSACASTSTRSPMATVQKVDLNRYLGTWFEVAAIPMKQQAQCARGTTATYSRAGEGLIKVGNRCLREDGSEIAAEGRARIADGTTNAKLEVAFTSVLGLWGPYFGDYWVIGLADDYRFAIVGHPSRDYGWVLARATTLTADDWWNVQQTLKDRGYDLCRFKVTQQEGTLPAYSDLCTLPI